jgi:hypothetical protein
MLRDTNGNTLSARPSRVKRRKSPPRAAWSRCSNCVDCRELRPVDGMVPREPGVFSAWECPRDVMTALSALHAPVPPAHLRQPALERRVSPAYVQRMPRHSSIKLTVDLYRRWLPIANKTAVNRLDDPAGSEVVAETVGNGPKASAPRAGPSVISRGLVHRRDVSRRRASSIYMLTQTRVSGKPTRVEATVTRASLVRSRRHRCRQNGLTTRPVHFRDVGKTFGPSRQQTAACFGRAARPPSRTGRLSEPAARPE